MVGSPDMKPRGQLDPENATADNTDYADEVSPINNDLAWYGESAPVSNGDSHTQGRASLNRYTVGRRIA